MAAMKTIFWGKNSQKLGPEKTGLSKRLFIVFLKMGKYKYGTRPKNGGEGWSTLS